MGMTGKEIGGSCRELTSLNKKRKGAVISFFAGSRREYGLMSYLYETIFVLLMHTHQCPHHPSMPALPTPAFIAPHAKSLPASATSRLLLDTWALSMTFSALWHSECPRSCIFSFSISTICEAVTLPRHYFRCWEIAVSKTNQAPVPMVPISSLSMEVFPNKKPFLANLCGRGIDDGDQNTVCPQHMLVIHTESHLSLSWVIFLSLYLLLSWIRCRKFQGHST